MFLESLLWSVLCVITIIVPAVLIAVQEQQIEGPFGWSSLTFTKRWQIMSPISKIYRMLTGKDKWATKYHIVSNGIWVQIFLMALMWIPIFGFLSGLKDAGSFINVAGIAIFACIQMMWVEDYLWFLIHPYYGPERHNKDYVPWFQYYQNGIPKTYWTSMLAGAIVVIVATAITGNLKTLLIWGETMILLIVAIFLIIKNLSKKIKRLPLKKYWWKTVKNVVIQRCPYSIESKMPTQENSAFVIDDITMKQLIASGKAVPLKDSLGGK